MTHPGSARTLALTSLTLALGLSVASAQRAERIASPFERLDDTGARGHALLTFAPSAYDRFDAAHSRGGLTELAGLALPGGDSVDVLLRPVRVWEEGGRALVVGADGEVREMAPTVRLFAVHVAGRASTGFLGLSREMAHGYLTLDGESYLLSTGPEPGLPLAVSHTDDVASLGAGAFCNVLAEAGGARSDGGDGTSEPDEARAPAPKLLATKAFIECDKRFRDRFASTQATIDYATLLVAATSEVYRRDVAATISLPTTTCASGSRRRPGATRPPSVT